MKKGIIPILFVVFLTAVISIISTTKAMAKPDKTKPSSKSETKAKAVSYILDANILLLQAASGDKSKYKEAIRKCEEAIKLDPNYANSYLSLGIIYSYLGQYDKSDFFLDKVTVLDTNLQKSVKVFKEVNVKLQKMSPKERRAYEEKVKKLFSELNSFIKDIKDDIKENIKDMKEEELVDEGRTFLEDDKYDKAIEKFKEAIKINPRYTDAYFYLGLAYSDKENYNEANDAWDKAINIDPKLNSKVSELKKINQLHQSMTPEGKRSYQKWLKEEKAEKSLPAEEREKLEKARSYYTDGFMALADAGLHGNKEKYGEAITNFEKALKVKPDYGKARLALGDTYYSQKLYNQAMEEYKKLAVQNPKSINAHIGLTRCYVKLKKFEEAKKECNIILKMDPNNIKVKEYLRKLQSKKYVVIEAKEGKKPGEFALGWKASDSDKRDWPMYPTKLAVDSKGNIYIADTIANTTYHRIQKFGPKGNLLFVIEGIKYVSTMIIDFKDNLIVADGGNCIKRFNSEGELLLQFGEKGKYGKKGGDKQFLNIIRLSVDPEGNIYVEDRTGLREKPTLGCRIRKFSHKGELIKDFEGVTREDDPPIFDKEGNMYKILSEKIGRARYRYTGVQKTNPKGKTLLQIKCGYPLIGIDTIQNIYLYNATERKVLKYDKKGNLVEKIYLPPREGDRFTDFFPQIDPNGNIYDMEIFYIPGPKQRVKVIKYQ